jgi:hypothetical protein
MVRSWWPWQSAIIRLILCKEVWNWGCVNGKWWTQMISISCKPQIFTYIYCSLLATLAQSILFLDMLKFFKIFFSKRKCKGKWRIFWNIKEFSNLKKKESSKLSNYSADMCWSSPCTMISCLLVLKIGFPDQSIGSALLVTFQKTFCSPLVYLCCRPKCERIEGSTNFSFQTQILQFVWISSNKIHLKINIFHTLALKNCEINSTKSDSLRAFQQHQE